MKIMDVTKTYNDSFPPILLFWSTSKRIINKKEKPKINIIFDIKNEILLRSIIPWDLNAKKIQIIDIMNDASVCLLFVIIEIQIRGKKQSKLNIRGEIFNRNK